MPRRFRRAIVFVTAFSVGLWVADAFLAAQPTTAPATTTQPASQPVIDPAAKAVLERASRAYAKLPIAVEGTLAIHFDVAGMKQEREQKLTAAALDAKHFSHEIEKEVRLVADGKTMNVLDLKQNQFITNKVDDEKAAAEADELVGAMLREQNPALLLALSSGSGAQLFGGKDEVRLDASANSPEFDVLLVEDGQTKTRMFVHKQSGLLDRIETDFRPLLEKQGATQINQASATIRYSKTDFAPALAADAFAFKPPADAIEASAEGGEMLAAGGDPDRLVGKPAPAFELADLDGKSVSLQSLQGKVVVLDFWATWCGPCRVIMPDLNALAKEHEADDVVVLAVNVAEEVETVRTFLQEQKLSLRAVLDKDRSVSRKYQVTGIPQTVVIGRDGNVSHVHVGASPNYKSELKEQIEAALK